MEDFAKQHCPQCGAELDGDSEGLCPMCLMAGAFTTQATIADSSASPVDLQHALEYDGFGPYRILRVLGEGGMGTVYLAEQSEPIRRTVALKVVKLGMDTSQVLARFNYERQAVALMDHPNIARVYDASATEKGRPYFVMEYVDGVPITEYCDRHRLTTAQRLELFVPVCQAVQHAHQKGVIHRDIKPSNVLVTEQDGRAVPKVIDFGIAKATDQRALENTMITQFGQFVGTPVYISPEQADLVTNDVDTSSDVYSLGVLLYELLVGAVPFDSVTLRKAGLAEVLRIIREEEAPPLPAKLTQMGKTATQVAERRGTDALTLRRQLAGDLNWIVLKAVEKSRTRRYPSVTELAADIRRHLEDRPVLASPPGATYRARKFARRHRVAVSAAVLVAASLIAGVAATLWEARAARKGRAEAEIERSRADAQATRAEEKAREADEQRNLADAQRHEAETQRNDADAQRRQAVELFNGVRELAHSMLFDVEGQLTSLQGATAAREVLVRTSLEYLGRLSKSPLSSPQLRKELAAAYLKVAALQGHRLFPNIGDPDGARVSFDAALRLLEPLIRTEPANAELRHLLVTTYLGESWLSNYAETETWYHKALDTAEAGFRSDPNGRDTRWELAEVLLFDTRWIADAQAYEASLLRARELCAALVREDPKDIEARLGQWGSYFKFGFPNPSISQIADPEKARQSLLEALRLAEEGLRDYPSNAAFQQSRTRTLGALAQNYEALNRPKDAMDAVDRAIAAQQQLAGGDPRNAMHRLYLSRFLSVRAQFLTDAGRREEAMAANCERLAALEQLIRDHPGNPEAQFELAAANGDIGIAMEKSGDFRSFLEYERKSEEQAQEVVRKYPGNLDFRIGLLYQHAEVALAMTRANGDRAGALAKYRQALAECEALASTAERRDGFRFNRPQYFVSLAHRWVAKGMTDLGDGEGAAQEYLKALPMLERLAGDYPRNVEFRWELASARHLLALIYQNLRNWKAVVETEQKALPFFESVYPTNPQDAKWVTWFAATLQTMALAYRQLGDHSHALPLYRRVAQVREQYAALDASDVLRAHQVTLALLNVGIELRTSGDRRGSMEYTSKAESLLDRYSPEKEATLAKRRALAQGYLEVLRSYAALHEDEAADRANRKSLPLLEGIYRADSADFATRNNLIAAYLMGSSGQRRAGDLDGARRLEQQALDTRLGHMNSAVLSEWIDAGVEQQTVAVLQGRLNRPADQEGGLRKAIEFYQQGYAKSAARAPQSTPPDAVALRYMVQADLGMSQCHGLLKEAAKAREFALRAVADAQKLATSYPRDELAASLLTDVRSDAALLEWERAGEAGNYAAILEPGFTPQMVRLRVAVGYRRLYDPPGRDYLEAEILRATQKSAEMLDALVKENAREPEYRVQLATSVRRLGEAYLARKEAGVARQNLERARGLLLELSEQKLLPKSAMLDADLIATEIATCDTLLAQR